MPVPSSHTILICGVGGGDLSFSVNTWQNQETRNWSTISGSLIDSETLNKSLPPVQELSSCKMGVAHWQHQPQRVSGSHRKSVPSERTRLFINISRITREWATRCYGLRVYLWGEKLRQGLKLHRNRPGGVIKFRFRAEVQLIGGCSCTPSTTAEVRCGGSHLRSQRSRSGRPNNWSSRLSLPTWWL